MHAGGQRTFTGASGRHAVGDTGVGVSLNGGLHHFFLLRIRAAGHAAHDPCRPADLAKGEELWCKVWGRRAVRAQQASHCRMALQEERGIASFFLKIGKRYAAGAQCGALALFKFSTSQPPSGALICRFTAPCSANLASTIWLSTLSPNKIARPRRLSLAGTAPGRASCNGLRSYQRSQALLRFRDASCRSTDA